MKRHFALMEVLIGIGLAALLLTSLFSLFRHFNQMHRRVESVREERHWTYLVQLKLGQIFEATELDTPFRIGSHPKGEGCALHFVYDNGLDPSPPLCGIVNGSLFLDKETGGLSLCTMNERGDMRTEVLAFRKKGANLSFEGYDPLSKEWRAEWAYKTPPPLVKVSFNGEEFIFFLTRCLHAPMKEIAA